MSLDRANQGWSAPTLSMARLLYATDAERVDMLVAKAPPNSIHICQGFRGNGLVAHASGRLAQRRLSHWVVMEAVEEKSWADFVAKRLEYARLVRSWRKHIKGILAIGEATPEWLGARGMPLDRTFPFAYFMPDRPRSPQGVQLNSSPFTILFVGQHIERKRLDDLIDAAASLQDSEFELAVVGSGPLEASLRAKAQVRLGEKINWLSPRPMNEIPALMAQADCLVLPSRHDGWGAVVSESLMAGTPAICSNRCGSAVAVRASGRGGIFPAGDVGALAELLRQAIAEGRQTVERRAALADWASCLGATAGAAYLEAILAGAASRERPAPPWHSGAIRSDPEHSLRVLS